MALLTAKTSTIYISTGDDETRVYRSVGEVPLSLRKKLHRSTNGMHSATILIADRRGREELVRALQGLPSDVQSRLADNMRSRHQKVHPQTPIRPKTAPGRLWLELLLPVAVGLTLWLLVDSRL